MRSHNPFTTSTARALLRVFVVPNTHEAPRLFPRTASAPAIQHVRYANPYRKVAPSEIAKNSFNDPDRPLDSNIKSRYVNYVDEQGTFHADYSMRDLLQELRSRNTEARAKDPRANEFHLRQVGKAENGTPIVKWTTERDLRAEDYAKRKAPKTTEPVVTKQLELNWGLDQKGDLFHRLAKLKQFLEDGKRVEVIFAQKKRTRIVTPEEMQELVAQVREAAAGVPGAHEWRDAEGKIGRILTLRFRPQEGATGTGEGETKLSRAAKELDKKARKEAEREARRKKDEERQKKAEERKAELEKQRTIKVDDMA